MVDSIDPEKEGRVAVVWHNFADASRSSNAVVSWICSKIVACIPDAAAELKLESWFRKQMPSNNRPQKLRPSSCKVAEIGDSLNSELMKSAS